MSIWMFSMAAVCDSWSELSAYVRGKGSWGAVLNCVVVGGESSTLAARGWPRGDVWSWKVSSEPSSLRAWGELGRSSHRVATLLITCEEWSPEWQLIEAQQMRKQEAWSFCLVIAVKRPRPPSWAE